MKLIIDRFEEGVAVCEDENRAFVQLPLTALTFPAREGDVLSLENGVLTPLPEETKARRARIRARFQRLTKSRQ